MNLCIYRFAYLVYVFLQGAADQEVPVLYFPAKSGNGLSRRKRDWVIPDINVAENHRGPYPLKISQVRGKKGCHLQFHAELIHRHMLWSVMVV